jgi:hypothetical protein
MAKPLRDTIPVSHGDPARSVPRLVTMTNVLFLLFWYVAALLPAAAIECYVDPDFAGTSTGTAKAPWRELDSAAWSAINRQLVQADVTIYFSARDAKSDTDQLTNRQIQLRRTDNSSHRLTLDGMTKYNSDDVKPLWLSYSGTSRFNIHFVGDDAITATTSAPRLSSNVTIRGFRAFSTDGKPINYWGGNYVIIEYNEVSHYGAIGPGGGGAGIQIQYARKEGNNEVPCVPDEGHNCGVHDIIIRNNLIHHTTGEGIYVGGVANQNFTAHSNILIEDNVIYDTGYTSGSEGDDIDIKDGHTNIVVRGNRLYEPTPRTGRDGIVTLSGGVYERNFIYNMGRAGIVLSAAWNAAATRRGSEVRNNIIVNCGGSLDYKWSHGIIIDGSSSGDQWVDAKILNNTIYKVNAAIPGDGIGIFVNRYAKSVAIANNIVFESADVPFQAESGSLGTHGSNLYYRSGTGAVMARYGALSFTSATMPQFEQDSISCDPRFVNLGEPFTEVGFRLRNVSPAIGRAQAVPSFGDDYFGVLRGPIWDLGAAQFSADEAIKPPLNPRVTP